MVPWEVVCAGNLMAGSDVFEARFLGFREELAGESIWYVGCVEYLGIQETLPRLAFSERHVVRRDGKLLAR